MRHRPALLVLLAVAIAGCESTSAAAQGSSCARGDSAMCVDLVSVESGLVAQAVCLEVIGPSTTFAAGTSCPLEGTVGSCAVAAVEPRYAIVYYAPGFTRETATTDCGARGGIFGAP
jgi:hypothetical protein